MNEAVGQVCRRQAQMLLQGSSAHGSTGMLQSAPSVRRMIHGILFPNTKQLRISAAPSGLADNPLQGRGKALPGAQPALDPARRYLWPWDCVAGERQGHRGG